MNPQNTINRTVSIRPADVLFIHWATSLNTFGLFREALAEQMTSRNIDRNKLVALVDEAHDLDKLVEQTSGLEDLAELLEPPNAGPPQYE